MTDPILEDVPVPIRTQRLLIRPVMPGDGAQLHAAKRASWKELSSWMIWAAGDPPESVESDEAMARNAYAKFIRREDLMMAAFLRDTGKLVVCSGLHRMDWKMRRFEIGYWCRSDETGKGYATETANALTRYAFAALKANRVEIFHAEGNDKSAAIIKRLGFLPEGVQEKASILPDGRIVAKANYVRLSPEGLPDLDVSWGSPL